MEKKQVAGFIVSPDWVENPVLSEKYIKEMSEHGYYAAVLFVRHQKRSVINERVRDAIREIVDLCHRYSLKVILDTDPTFWSPDFVEAHPEAALHIIKGIDVRAIDGSFEFRAPLPILQEMTPYIFNDVVAVFREGGESYEQVQKKDISYEWMNIFQGVLIKGSIRGGYSGSLVFYVGFKTFALADLSHPLYLEGQKKLLDMYKGIPLDGFGWDEPGKYSAQGYFKSGEFFPEFFHRTNGYELYSHLIYLDHCDNTQDAVRVRCDYYRTLSEMNFIAQKEHNEYARSLFGKNLIFGTHQTWSGIPADLAGGVMDYFKLGRVLTASWTDGSWDCSQFKYQSYFFILAESIKKELNFRDAYYNDWGTIFPPVENMRLANRFKMLFHINWFNIFFSDSSESLFNYRIEPLKSYAKEDVKDLDTFDNFIGNSFYPHTDVAILYSWETIAAAPKWLARLYYMMFANLSLNLVDSGLFGVQMSCDALASAKIEKGYFTAGRYRYRILIVPYGYVLPRAVYLKIKDLLESCIPVIFLGPPPEFESESGKVILYDFAGYAGFKPFSFLDYQQLYATRKGLPSPYEWEPSWSDFSYPVSASDAEVFMDREGRVLYLKSPDKPLYYMPQADPREDAVNLIKKVLPADIEVFSDGTYYRLYYSEEKESFIVVAVAKGHIPGFDLTPASYGSGLRAPVKEHQIKILFRFKNGELVITGGNWCAVKISNNRIVDKIGNCPEVIWRKR